MKTSKEELFKKYSTDESHNVIKAIIHLGTFPY
jgi:ribosome maturation protein Sdo1